MAVMLLMMGRQQHCHIVVNHRWRRWPVLHMLQNDNFVCVMTYRNKMKEGRPNVEVIEKRPQCQIINELSELYCTWLLALCHQQHVNGHADNLESTRLPVCKKTIMFCFDLFFESLMLVILFLVCSLGRIAKSLPSQLVCLLTRSVKRKNVTELTRKVSLCALFVSRSFLLS